MAFIAQDLSRFAAETPDAVAVRSGPVCLSWQELKDAVAGLETLIRGQTRRGARVALMTPDPISLLTGFLACARTARLAMVLDTDWPVAQTDALLAELDPELTLSDAVSANEAPFAVQGLDPGNDAPPNEDDLFYAGFTSGSTGVPKGYQRTHASWLRSFELSDAEFSTGAEASAPGRVVIPGKLTHSLHLYGAVYGLCRGIQVVLAPRFDPRAVIADLSVGTRGTAIYATPTQLHYLAEVARRSGPVPAVRQVFASGAKWGEDDRRALAKVFPAAQLFEFYGASETSFITVSKTSEKVPEGSVGRAAFGVKITIGDPDDPLPAGQPGAIWVQSMLLFAGYICGAAPQTRWKNGWLTFGDHGYLDKDRFLFLTGRSNRMIVTSGLNVYPEEIEAVLLKHPAVGIAVVAGVADPVRGERLEAIVSVSGTESVCEYTLLAHCRTLLPGGKVPRKIHIKDKLPLTAGGKPDIQKIIMGLVREQRTDL